MIHTIPAGHWYAFHALSPATVFVEIIVAPPEKILESLMYMPVYWKDAVDGNERAIRCVPGSYTWNVRGQWADFIESFVNATIPGCMVPFSIREKRISLVSHIVFKIIGTHFALAHKVIRIGGLIFLLSAIARHFSHDACTRPPHVFQLGDITARMWGRLTAFCQGMQGVTRFVLEDRRRPSRGTEALRTERAITIDEEAKEVEQGGQGSMGEEERAPEGGRVPGGERVPEGGPESERRDEVPLRREGRVPAGEGSEGRVPEREEPEGDREEGPTSSVRGKKEASSSRGSKGKGKGRASTPKKGKGRGRGRAIPSAKGKGKKRARSEEEEEDDEGYKEEMEQWFHDEDPDEEG